MLRPSSDADRHVLPAPALDPAASARGAAALTIRRELEILVALLVLSVGAGFVARAYTVRHLPLGSVGPVDVITITPEDLTAAREVLPEVLKDPAIAARLGAARDHAGRVLAYFVPIDYTMQGMIADTGEEWKLFAQHATVRMITDYVLHPAAHLAGGHGPSGCDEPRGRHAREPRAQAPDHLRRRVRARAGSRVARR